MPIITKSLFISTFRRFHFASFRESFSLLLFAGKERESTQNTKGLSSLFTADV
jgi:hypothetical protein